MEVEADVFSFYRFPMFLFPDFFLHLPDVLRQDPHRDWQQQPNNHVGSCAAVCCDGWECFSESQNAFETVVIQRPMRGINLRLNN